MATTGASVTIFNFFKASSALDAQGSDGNAVSTHAEVVMLIWSGFGFLTALITVLGLALGIVLDPVVQQAAPGLPPETGFAVGVAIAAVANWFLGAWLSNRPACELIDAKTGQRVVLRQRHRLFWIPMQYYSIPC